MHPLLADIHSWKLERISPATFPPDIIVTFKRQGLAKDYSDAELEAIANLMRTGHCYRCRIAKNRWHFAATVQGAIEAAVKAHKKQA